MAVDHQDHSEPYSPLQKKNLAESVANALLATELRQLKGLKKFAGPGVYAIYYIGKLPLYKPLTKSLSKDDPEQLIPIYVGKADPPGSRVGGSLQSGKQPSLHARLKQHAATIDLASDGPFPLKLEDFRCRYLVVDEIFIALGESLLIDRFRPLWNGLLFGFGNHAVGKGRDKGARSAWDTLHPGRKWADKLPPRPETVEQLAEKVARYFTDRA